MNTNIYKPVPPEVVQTALAQVDRGESYDWQTVAEILASQVLYLQGELELCDD